MPSENEFAHQIYQAAGMVAVQAEATIADALELLTLRAATLGLDLRETALQVLDRRISFDSVSLLGRHSGNV